MELLETHTPQDTVTPAQDLSTKAGLKLALATANGHIQAGENSQAIGLLNDVRAALLTRKTSYPTDATKIDSIITKIDAVIRILGGTPAQTAGTEADAAVASALGKIRDARTRLEILIGSHMFATQIGDAITDIDLAETRLQSGYKTIGRRHIESAKEKLEEIPSEHRGSDVASSIGLLADALKIPF